MKLRALIFDVDGTLAETEEAHRAAFNDTFADEGLNWHWDQETYGRLLKTTGGKERMMVWVRDHLALDPARWGQRVAAIHAKKTSRYVEIIQSGDLHLRPGIQELIDQANRADLVLAIATTTSRPNVEVLCRSIWHQPAHEVFSVIAAGDEVTRKKPAPDVYQLALQRLNLPPTACLAFEDTAHGLRSAMAAGLRCVAVPARYSLDQDFKEASLLAGSYQRVSLDDLVVLV